jgi:hypothetical protein
MDGFGGKIIVYRVKRSIKMYSTVVKAQVEGLGFLVLICVVTKVCNLCTSANYINRNTLFSSNYMFQIVVLLSMGIFVIHVSGLC